MGRLIHHAKRNGDMRVVGEIEEDGTFYIIDDNGDVRYGGNIGSDDGEKE